MNILIDSHVLVWLLYRSARLSPDSKKLLESADTVYVSSATLWELAIKFSIGKLPYPPEELLRGIDEAGLKKLPIRDKHICGVPKVALPHGDTFDKLLVSQSEAEGCSLMTADSAILKSKYRTIKIN